MPALMGGAAHAASLDLGLCDGEMSATGYSKTGSGTIQVALVLPASQFARYEGASLSGLRIALCTIEGISNVQGWVRTSIEGENLCTASFTSPAVGWNELAFDTPTDYHLRADQDLVIGYQFDQTRSTKCISLAGNTSPDCYWLARNGSWQNLSASAPGAVSVELVVEGEQVPAVNLAVESCSYDPLVAYGEPFQAQVVVRNVARSPISGYRCLYQPGTDAPEAEIDRSNVTLQYRQRDTLDITMPSSVQQPDEVRFAVPFHIVAEGDQLSDDDSGCIYRSNYTQSYPHLLLMEEFTTEECSNCPRAINTLAQMVNEGYQFAQISHHVGYNTDFLTVEADKSLLWLYGEDGTFAPAGMFDRTYDADFHTVSKYDYPVFSIGYADTFRPALQKALAMPAFVRVTPEVNYDAATRQLVLDVTAQRALTLEALTQAPRLTVVLIEDSIPAQHQAGISSTTFCHRHVCRQTLTDIWGDPIAWDESGQASLHLEFAIPDEWNADRMEIVAFVNSYNPEDRCDCRVFNTATTPLVSSSEQAIRSLHVDMSGVSPALDILGRPATHGMLIRQGRIECR